MSVMGLSAGGVLTQGLGLDANWLFITRDVGILLAAIAMVYRWYQQSNGAIMGQSLETSKKSPPWKKALACSPCSNWCPTFLKGGEKTPAQTLGQDQQVQLENESLIVKNHVNK